MKTTRLFAIITTSLTIMLSSASVALAQMQALVVAPDGNVGVGIASPTQPLHVARSDGSARVLVQETNATPAQRELFALENAGNTRFSIRNTAVGVTWLFLNSAIGTFRISDVENPNTVELDLDQAGNLTTSGTVNGVSDRNAKTNFRSLDSQEVLNKVVALPITEWTYKHDDGNKHIGPVSQDFHAAFGLGKDDLTIALTDMSGVALAAIQALNEKLAEKDMRIASLESKLSQLEELVDRLVAQRKTALLDQEYRK